MESDRPAFEKGDRVRPHRGGPEMVVDAVYGPGVRCPYRCRWADPDGLRHMDYFGGRDIEAAAGTGRTHARHLPGLPGRTPARGLARPGGVSGLELLLGVLGEGLARRAHLAGADAAAAREELRRACAETRRLVTRSRGLIAEVEELIARAAGAQRLTADGRRPGGEGAAGRTGPACSTSPAAAATRS